MSIHTYTGEQLKTPFSYQLSTAKSTIISKTLPPYFPEADLVEAVNLALMLKRPLLLMGEPGCGKTKLAQAVAVDLHKERFEEFFFEWHVKSTTKARDGIYTFDAIKRLRDMQLNEREDITKENKLEGKLLLDHFQEKGYIRMGPLAKAFNKGAESAVPPILLIDEIDKAEIDFPNDLLLELDQNSYQIEETQTQINIPRENAPLIIITSNGEKELPPAFLRRCIFHYIPFPRSSTLDAILKHRFILTEKVLQEQQESFRQKIIQAFAVIRERTSTLLSEKKVSTSELIDWYEAALTSIERGEINELAELETRLQEITDKATTEKVDIPFPQVLIKNHETLKALLVEKHNVP